jgi:hypothetical protein
VQRRARKVAVLDRCKEEKNRGRCVVGQLCQLAHWAGPERKGRLAYWVEKMLFDLEINVWKLIWW